MKSSLVVRPLIGKPTIVSRFNGEDGDLELLLNVSIASTARRLGGILLEICARYEMTDRVSPDSAAGTSWSLCILRKK